MLEAILGFADAAFRHQIVTSFLRAAWFDPVLLFDFGTCNMSFLLTGKAVAMFTYHLMALISLSNIMGEMGAGEYVCLATGPEGFYPFFGNRLPSVQVYQEIISALKISEISVMKESTSISFRNIR